MANQKIKSKGTLGTKKLLIAISIVVFLAVAGWGGYILSRASTVNYAEETARPLMERLIEAGAVKKCDIGDDGRGISNRQPWYRAYFEITRNEAAAVELITAITRENGYVLTHASPSNRGHLGAVADIYIDKWYFDNSSKKNPYSDLSEGSISLSMQVNANGLDTACSQGIVIDDERSAIGIHVELPDFKR